VADFPTCFAFVLSNEDFTPPRYETKPDPTRKNPLALSISGINSAAFPKEFEEIFAIPQKQRGPAIQGFYQLTYWNPWIAQLENPIAMRVMDTEVNDGAGEGVRLLQRAVNTCRGRTGFIPLVEDGGWGAFTVAAARSLYQTTLISCFKMIREAFYRDIVAADPAEAPNLAGWLARAEK
jgi:hypothetical protein